MMARSSPRRNQRSKGFKVKHAIQLCLVIGVGVWLVYQVRHYYDKKAEYQDSTKTGDDVLILVGRKGLPQVEEVIGHDVGIKEEEERSNNVENVDGGEVVHDHFHDKTEAGAERRGDSIDGDKESDESKENVNGDQAAEENSDVPKESKEKIMENGDRNKEIEEGKETESRDKSNEGTRENTMEEKRSGEEVAGGVIKKVVEEDNGMETKEKESKEDKLENSGRSDENLNSDHSKEAREEHYKEDDTSSAVEHESGNFDAASGEVQGYRDKTGKSEQIESKENAKTEVAEVDPNELPSAIEHEPVEKNTTTIVTNEKGGSENGKKKSDEGSHGTRTEETELNEQQQVDSNSIAISSGNSDSSPNETHYAIQNQNETMEKIQLKGEDSSVNNVVLMETEKSDADAGNQQSDSNVLPSNATNNLDSVNQELKGSSNTESFASDGKTANHNEDAVNEEKSSGHSGDTNQESISLLNTNGDTDAGKKEDVDSSNSQEDTLSSKSGNEDAGKEERTNSTKSLEKDASSNENHTGDAAQNQNESADHNNMDITNQTQQVDSGHNEIKHTAVKSNTSNKPDSSEEHVNSSESSTSKEDKESSSDTNTNNVDSQSDSGNSSQNGSVDSSNSSVSHGEKEARVTLPEIQNQRENAAAAE